MTAAHSRQRARMPGGRQGWSPCWSIRCYCDLKQKAEDSARWITAIEEGKESLKKNNTWELVDEKEAIGIKTLSSKWLFNIKENGRYKARLVVRGFEQEYKVNYEETYSPVVSSSTMRLLFASAGRKNVIIRQFDIIKTAFLCGDLQEEIIWMFQKNITYQTKFVN